MQLKERFAELGRSRYVFPLVSLLLLAPCYWQPRLQAGDLSSHIYNAWLAQLIESGRTQGLTVVNQTTNILFDLILGSLFRLVGAEAAQRIGVSLAVLVFTWGAFAFVRAVSGRRPWHLLPCIAMLAYGWVFHMGFFNFYLSLGLCFWAMAVIWEMKPRRVALALPIFLLAYLAHALPVLWTAGLLMYVGHRPADCTPPPDPVDLHLRHGPHYGPRDHRQGHVRSLVAGPDRRSPPASTRCGCSIRKYYLVLMGLLAVWALMFLGLLRLSGPRAVIGSIPFQLCVLSAAVVLILPDTVLDPRLPQRPQLHRRTHVAGGRDLRVRDVGHGAAAHPGALGPGGGVRALLRLCLRR